MKRSLIALFTCATLITPALALEKRTFTSADGTKTFEGRLRDYDPEKGFVEVRKGMRNIKFRLDLLSDKDKEYVKENANAVAAANAIRLDFELWKGERETIRTDNERTTRTPAGYEIALRNWTKEHIQNVEVRYTVFHRKDAENGPGSITQTEGSISISTLFAGREDPYKTDPVTLVRYSRDKAGGG